MIQPDCGSSGMFLLHSVLTFKEEKQYGRKQRVQK